MTFKRSLLTSHKTSRARSSTQGAGQLPDGTTRFRAADGRELFHFMGCSTFSEYSVVADISVAKVSAQAAEQLEKLALLGCGVSTGYGAALNTAQAPPT